MFLAAPNCAQGAPPGACYWAPAAISPGLWWIFALIVVAAGLIIYGLERGRPSLKAVAVWLASVVLFAVSAELIELYTAAAARH